ncbi:MAG: ImmA/IrrE family metallo-endopeptidase [Kribbellaceae bacterium]|nr:ImmA/IrrE family metallo-endopeptidase [Kribbellaceae bacterium]
MGVDDEKILGARVREARELAGLTQGELAGRINLDRTAVNKVEAGIRKVTALELSDIAAALGVRMASFFSEPIPALVSHRSAQGLDTADSKIDRLLAQIASDVEFVHALGTSELGLPDRIEPLPSPLTMAEAEDLAAQARKMLGLDTKAPVTELANRVSVLGLLAFSIDLGVDTADAGTIMLGQGAVSLVNSHNKVGRRRLALAHELGHFLVADEYTIDWRVSDLHSSDVECRLDRFARALLLPEAGLRTAWSRQTARSPREIAVVLASEFRVDMATLARRLDELGMVDSAGAAAVRGIRTTRTDIVEFGLNVPTELEGLTLPLSFQKAVLHAFRQERVSRERALELLYNTFDDADLPALRERREDELWNFVS